MRNISECLVSSNLMIKIPVSGLKLRTLCQGSMFLYSKKKATIKRILPPVEHQGTIIYLLWSDTLGKKKLKKDNFVFKTAKLYKLDSPTQVHVSLMKRQQYK